MSKNNYKLLINNINKINDKYIDLKCSIINNNVKIEYNTYIYNISINNYNRIKKQIIDKSYKK